MQGMIHAFHMSNGFPTYIIDIDAKSHTYNYAKKNIHK